MSMKMTSLAAAAALAAIVAGTSVYAEEITPKQTPPTPDHGMMRGDMMGQSGEDMKKMHAQMTKMAENCNKMMESTPPAQQK